MSIFENGLMFMILVVVLILGIMFMMTSCVEKVDHDSRVFACITALKDHPPAEIAKVCKMREEKHAE